MVVALAQDPENGARATKEVMTKLHSAGVQAGDVLLGCTVEEAQYQRLDTAASLAAVAGDVAGKQVALHFQPSQPLRPRRMPKYIDSPLLGRVPVQFALGVAEFDVASVATLGARPYAPEAKARLLTTARQFLWEDIVNEKTGGALPEPFRKEIARLVAAARSVTAGASEVATPAGRGRAQKRGRGGALHMTRLAKKKRKETTTSTRAAVFGGGGGMSNRERAGKDGEM